MKKLKLIFCRTEFYLMARPRLLALLVFIVCLATFSIFETIRARLYLNSVNDYKNSVKVQNVTDTVGKIGSSTLSVIPAEFCGFDSRPLLADVNEAYRSETQVDVAKLLSDLGISLEEISPPPSFNSLAQFMPGVKQARRTSVDIADAVTELARLAQGDIRSQYCLGLKSVLSEVYFLSDIGIPSGVSSLGVGQLENFQVNLGQAQNLLLKLNPPQVFVDEHIEINELLKVVSADLRKDEGQYQEFSRVIEKNVETLDYILANIEEKSQDLRATPTNMSIQAQKLTAERKSVD